MTELVQSMTEAIAHVRAGSLIAIAGGAGTRRPLALVRALARAGIGDLRLTGWADGPEAGLLGSEPLQVAPIQAFQAGSLGVDFLPARRSTGTSSTVVSPISGQEYDVIRAVRPDVVLLHADWADEKGNVVLADSPPTWSNDRDLVNSAASVIVSVERLVSPLATARRMRDRLVDPDRVTAIVHAPFGAHPLAFDGIYPAGDAAQAAAGDADDHWGYLDSIGIARLITRSTTTN